MKTTIIIPTKNEEKTIKKIINGARPYGNEIIIVDGHSKDNTREVAKKLKTKVIIDNRKGKGAALRIAAKNARYNLLVFIDADGSHNPKDIKKLVLPIKNNHADLVIGSRMRGGSDELHGNFSQFIRLMGNTIINLIINYIFNRQFTDCQNGFRAIKKGVFLDIKTKENRFTIEQEMVIKCLKKKYNVIEVPAHEYVRVHGKSNINLFKEGWRYVWSLFKNIFFN
jgi:dolichol-phosphate mannosyltransferase